MSRAKKAVRGSLWMSSASYITGLIAFAGNLVLARLLMPEDFGTFAFAAATLTLIFMISGFGAQEAIVQCRDEEIRDLVPTAFGITIILGVVLATGGTLLGLYLADTQGLVVGQLVVVLSWLKLVRMLTQVYTATLQREMVYSPIAWSKMVANPLSFLLAIAAAWAGFGVWSLLIKEIVELLVVFLVVYKASKFTYEFRFDTRAVRWIWSFGWKTMFSRMGEVIFGKWDNLIVGSFLGVTMLGHYSMAYRLALVGHQFTQGPIQAITHSTYASVQKEQNNLNLAFEKTSYWLIRVAVPIALLVWFCGKSATLILYGANWELAGAVFQNMVLFISLLPLQSNLKSFLIGSGNINRLLWVQFGQIIFFIPTLILAAAIGDLIMVAWTLNITTVFTLSLMIYQIQKIATVRWGEIIFKPVAAGLSVLLLMLLFVIPQLASWPQPLWVELIMQIITISVSYLAFLSLFEYKTLRVEWNRIRLFLAK